MTNYTERAHKIVLHAEIEIRSLIEECARGGNYTAVSELANLANSLGRLTEGSETRATAPETPRVTKSLVRKKDYPRFVRSGERLVKIGWSKKRAAAYEHKVPREMVARVIRAISDTARPGKAFTVDSLPLVSKSGANGEEPPTYQAYVVIAWLRQLGALQKQGRDGYILVKGLADTLERGWSDLEDKE